MQELPPLLRDQRKIDADHLRLLYIFHFILSGFSILGIGFLVLHYEIMQTVFNNPEMWSHQPHGSPPPKEFFNIFKWFYLAFGIILLFTALMNVASAIFLKQRTHRIFSLVIAGLDCLQFPFGTALGVFTFIVLLRESVNDLYNFQAHAEKLTSIGKDSAA